MGRVGIMGGTFDPVHLGHIGLLETAIKELKLDKGILMPAYIQPFKQDRRTASAVDRLNMLNMAAEESDLKIEVSTWEIDKGDISYTFDTIDNYKRENPEDEVFFIMGSDSMKNLKRWYKGKELINLVNFAVGLRPNNDMEDVLRAKEELEAELGARIYLLNELMIPISSTMIREKVEKEESIYGLVSPGVEEYIYEHKLYT